MPRTYRATGITVSVLDDQREYHRQWRALRIARTLSTRQRSTAYNAALRKLRDKHRDEFDRLYRRELGKV